MKLHLQNNSGIQIRAYGPGQITLSLPPRLPADTGVAPVTADTPPNLQSLETVSHSFLLTPTHLERDWSPEHFEQLEPVHVEPMLALEPELVLLGTGARLRFPHPAFGAALMERRIGMEVMDTAAACRTYNILLGEGRRVAAALLL